MATAPSDGTLKLLAFAGARDLIGHAECSLELGAARTAAELWEPILARYPALAPYRNSIRLAINGTYARPHDPVQAGDEVALIPPVAGG